MEAIATAVREVRSRARFNASRGRKVEISTDLVYHMGDASQVEEECHHLQHSRLREQMS